MLHSHSECSKCELPVLVEVCLQYCFCC